MSHVLPMLCHRAISVYPPLLLCTSQTTLRKRLSRQASFAPPTVTCFTLTCYIICTAAVAIIAGVNSSTNVSVAEGLDLCSEERHRRFQDHRSAPPRYSSTTTHNTLHVALTLHVSLSTGQLTTVTMPILFFDKNFKHHTKQAVYIKLYIHTNYRIKFLIKCYKTHNLYI